MQNSHKTYSTSKKKNLLFLSIIFIINLFLAYSIHFSIIAATCMTVQQVATDTRCLYIWSGKVYHPPGSPHHGHSCGTDVTSIIPSSHLNNPASYLLPNYIADVCAAVTPTPSPTQIPTPTPTAVQRSTPTPTIPLPTPTTSPNGITFSLTVFLHGVGHGGDNANPTGSGNMNPSHSQRTVTITLLNANNQIAGTAQGVLNYNNTSGNFTGNISVPAVSSGTYIIEVQTNSFLRKLAPGFQQLSSGSSVTIPAVSLVAGDINNDGQIDVIDYNVLISCFGSKQNSTSCINAQGADLNDDTIVNGTDYNLFLRELSVQKGV